MAIADLFPASVENDNVLAMWVRGRQVAPAAEPAIVAPREIPKIGVHGRHHRAFRMKHHGNAGRKEPSITRIIIQLAPHR